MYDAAMIAARLRLIVAFLLSACSLTTASVPLQAPTATTVRLAPATLVPTMQRQLNAVATLTHPVEPTPGLVDCSGTEPDRPHYAAVANLNYGQHAALVREQVSYTNTSDETLSQLVFDVEANEWPDIFSFEAASLRDIALTAELTGRRLTVDLPQPLDPACRLTLSFDFKLQIPQIGAGINAYRGYLGYTSRQLNLGHWLPTIVPRIDGEWILRDAILIGEQTLTELSDWDVTLNVNGAPESLEIAGPGVVSQPSTHSWAFQLAGARDFAVSLSDQFRVSSTVSASGTTVELYCFDDAQVTLDNGTQVDGAAHALQVASRSLSMYSDLFGPYLHDRMVVVEGDFPDGMEFSGLVFVGHTYFTRYAGNPAEFLTVITAHEVSHQWWYAEVGSDQALSPWLDEALAIYSEYVFVEEYYPDLKNWWWSWRVDSYAPEGYVDSTVYEFNSLRDYINAVYLRGAHMLNDLRRDLGTEAFFDLLRRYYEAGSGKIMEPSDFWAMLSDDELAATQATRRRYFRSP